jgi:hypothetical protein
MAASWKDLLGLQLINVHFFDALTGQRLTGTRKRLPRRRSGPV